MELLVNQTERIILLKIGKISRENIYEQTRKYWKVNFKRAQRATCVLAVCNNEVVAAYIPEYWKQTDNPEWEGRYEFTGYEWEKCPYIGCSVSQLYNKGCANPVRYLNL